uniref:Uncharacterized protein n=1 Tax=Panagrolaimus sp. JU765 TaxID=591449 RepID=A0AC34QXS5_9BILA
MVKLEIKSTETFAAVSPIRYSITFSTDKRVFAFSSVNDICFAASECLENPSKKGIILTIPLKKPAACLFFVKNEKTHDSGSDILLVIDSAGQLHVFDVKLLDDWQLEVSEVETGQPIDLPSDFCHGQSIGEDKVYFWCRRNVIFCRKHGSLNIQQFSSKADVKCFDSIVFNNLIFCVFGCVNGNVHFMEVDVTQEDFKFNMVGLVMPAPVPVTNVALKMIGDSIIAVFNHGTKVTAVSWEPAQSSSTDGSSLKVKRQLEMGGKHWFLSTDSVIGDFTSDISSLVFAKEKNRLLIVTNDRDFGVYDYKEDMENSGRFNWINVMLGGEAGERPFGYCGGVFAPNEEQLIIYNTRGAVIPFKMDKKGEDFYVATETAPPFNGHLSSITGAHWDPTGTLLFTAGSRSREIHILAPMNDGSICQIARPESHQYDIQCFAVVSGLTMIVGSDELPFRVYRASANYVESVKNLVGLDSEKLRKNEKSLPTTPFFKQAVLGVLNVAAGDSQADDEDHSGMVFTGEFGIN